MEEILLSLIQGEDGKNWAKDKKGWKDNENVYYCYWTGVHCDSIDKETIIGIFLPSSGLKGTLPSEFGGLVNLRELSLPDNNLLGPIPTQIANLPHLKILNLSKNSISGSIPTFASPSLQSIDLSSNKLSGTLNDDFGKFHERMTDIDLSDNDLSGFIPDSLSFMTMLDEISLSSNKFSGTIPISIGYLRSLRYLYLNNNQLMGYIPSTIARFSSPLAELWLQDNLLSGTIPSLTADMTELFNFYIDGNKFTGTVPKELCRKSMNADFFEGVEDVSDYFQSIACPEGYVSKYGTYPCELCHNKYFNPYLGRVGECIDMDQRDILQTLYDATDGDNWKAMTRHDWVRESRYYCSFSGVTCDDSQNIIALDLSNRGLRGTIPEELGFLRYLQHLDLSDNYLTGFLPSDLRWAPLEKLDVSGNNLQGLVPPSLCLKDGINGNGENGLYDCNNIACTASSYSSTGYGDCKPCVYSQNVLGSKHCVQNHHLFIQHDETSTFTLFVGTASILVALIFIVMGILSYVKRKRNMRYYETTNVPQYEI